MSNTKLYILLYMMVQIVLSIGITLCAIHFNRSALMWWYLLPALLCSMEVRDSKSDTSEKHLNNDKKN